MPSISEIVSTSLTRYALSFSREEKLGGNCVCVESFHDNETNFPLIIPENPINRAHDEVSLQIILFVETGVAALRRKF